MPKMIPVRAEMMKAKTTDPGEMMAFIEVKFEMTCGIAIPSRTPMNPPISDSNTASTIN